MASEALSLQQSQSAILEFAKNSHHQAQAAERASDLMTAALLYEEAYGAYRSVGAAQEATAVMKHVIRLMYAAYAED